MQATLRKLSNFGYDNHNRNLNQNTCKNKLCFELEFHNMDDKLVTCNLTIFQGKAKLLEKIDYSHSCFVSRYRCLVNPKEDLWVKKGDKVDYHIFKNYSSDYYFSRDEILVQIRTRHHNCADIHFKHNVAACFYAVVKYMPEMNLRLHELFDWDIGKRYSYLNLHFISYLVVWIQAILDRWTRNSLNLHLDDGGH